MSTKERSSKEIYDECFKVYGTCTDGSLEACLLHYGYHEAVKREKAKEDDKRTKS
jgi:hypothetical protein